MPSVESVPALLSKVSIDRENNLFKYPISNFKFEPKLENKNQVKNHISKFLTSNLLLLTAVSKVQTHFLGWYRKKRLMFY